MTGSTPEFVTSLFIQLVSVNLVQICDPKFLTKKIFTSKLNALLCSLIKKPNESFFLQGRGEAGGGGNGVGWGRSKLLPSYNIFICNPSYKLMRGVPYEN